MSDRRLWAKIDRGYLDNEKMVALLDESPTALLMHLASILYCTTHLTDGHVAPVVARRKVGGAKSDEDLLIRAGLWHPPGHDCPDCPQPAEGRIYVHDFLEHNEASSQVKRVSEKRSRAARARWDKERDAPAMQSASKLYANAMPEERREEKSRADQNTRSPAPPSSVRDPGPDRFDEFWEAYPRKVGKQKARGKFAAACKRTDPQVVIDGARRLAADPNLPETQFIPHPTTWLEGDRWDDPPLPARAGATTSLERNRGAAQALIGRTPYGQEPTALDWGGNPYQQIERNAS